MIVRGTMTYYVPVSALTGTAPAAATAATLAGTPTTGTAGTALAATTVTTTPTSAPAFMVLYTGGADVGSRVSVASGGTFAPTPAAAGSFTIRAYAAQMGGTPLVESAAITVAAAGVHYLSATASGTGSATVPYNANLMATTLLDVRARVRTGTYAAPAAVGALVYFWDGNGGCILSLGSDGTLHLIFKHSGATLENMASSAAVSAAVNAPVWLRAVGNSSNVTQGGLPANVVRFYTSPDGVTWTAFGADAALVAGNPMAAPSSIPLSIGTSAAGNLPPANTAFLAAQVWAEGVKVLDVDFTGQAPGATSFAAGTGQTVTVVAPGVIQ